MQARLRQIISWGAPKLVLLRMLIWTLQDLVAKAASQQRVLALLAHCTAGHNTSGPAGDAGQQRPGAGGAPDADAGPGRGGRRNLAALCARCGVDFAAGVITECARRGGLPDEAGFASGV